MGQVNLTRLANGLEPDMPLRKAAKRTLRQRIARLARLLKRSRTNPTANVETIHELRVATRRAAAALKAFGPCLRKKSLKKFRSRLHHIRNASAMARGSDVLLAEFITKRQDAAPETRGALDYLIRRTREARQEAQFNVEAVAALYKPKQLARLGSRLLKRRSRSCCCYRQRNAGSSGGPCEQALVVHTLQDAARAVMPRLVRDLHEASAHDLTVLENLHEMRIGGKKLRYAIEIFAPCFEATQRDALYSRLASLQERLGAINDSHERVLKLEDILCDLRERVKQSGGNHAFVNQYRAICAGMERLVDEERSLREQRRSDFLLWWQTFEADEFFMAADRLTQATLVQPAPAVSSRVEPVAPASSSETAEATQESVLIETRFSLPQGEVA